VGKDERFEFHNFSYVFLWHWEFSRNLNSQLSFSQNNLISLREFENFSHKTVHRKGFFWKAEQFHKKQQNFPMLLKARPT
jgi:hypothetical protein